MSHARLRRGGPTGGVCRWNAAGPSGAVGRCVGTGAQGSARPRRKVRPGQSTRALWRASTEQTGVRRRIRHRYLASVLGPQSSRGRHGDLVDQPDLIRRPGGERGRRVERIWQSDPGAGSSQDSGAGAPTARRVSPSPR